MDLDMGVEPPVPELKAAALCCEAAGHVGEQKYSSVTAAPDWSENHHAAQKEIEIGRPRSL